MNCKSAAGLKVGDKLVFSDGVKGVVRELNKAPRTPFFSLLIKWSNGQEGWIDGRDMRLVERDK